MHKVRPKTGFANRSKSISGRSPRFSGNCSELLLQPLQNVRKQITESAVIPASRRLGRSCFTFCANSTALVQPAQLNIVWAAK